MITNTPILSPSGNQLFNFIVDANNIDSDNRNGAASANYTSNITMYLSDTSISYDTADSKTTAGANINQLTPADVYTTKLVNGTLEIVLQNSVDAISSPVYLKFDPAYAATNHFTIVSINGTAYTGSYINVGTVPATSDSSGGKKTIEMIVSYDATFAQAATTDSTTLRVIGYEYYNSQQFTIQSYVEVTISAKYALLDAAVTIVDVNNDPVTGPYYFSPGQHVYMLSAISNNGNLATMNTLGNYTTFTQTVGDHMSIEAVIFGATKVTMTNSGSFLGKVATASITDSIAVGSNVYYVRVQVEITSAA